MGGDHCPQTAGTIVFDDYLRSEIGFKSVKCCTF